MADSQGPRKVYKVPIFGTSGLIDYASTLALSPSVNMKLQIFLVALATAACTVQVVRGTLLPSSAEIWRFGESMDAGISKLQTKVARAPEHRSTYMQS